jgi:hypothetical protein
VRIMDTFLHSEFLTQTTPSQTLKVEMTFLLRFTSCNKMKMVQKSTRGQLSAACLNLPNLKFERQSPLFAFSLDLFGGFCVFTSQFDSFLLHSVFDDQCALWKPIFIMARLKVCLNDRSKAQLQMSFGSCLEPLSQ